jgi:hypothetical protein
MGWGFGKRSKFGFLRGDGTYKKSVETTERENLAALELDNSTF